MNRLLIVLFTLLVAGGFAQKPGAAIDILHYTFIVRVNDHNDTIGGSAGINFHVLQSTDEIVLDLADVMKVRHVYGPDKEDLVFTQSKNKLTVKPIVKLEKGFEWAIGIEYGGRPTDGLIISKNKYGKRTFFSDHWPDRAHNWLPCVDHPADKASVDLIVEAPVRYQVVGNGLLIEETNIDEQYKLTHWQEKIALPLKVMCVGIAQFAVGYLPAAGDVPVSSWVFPENRDKGFADYAVAADILDFYQHNLAPFPYGKLANIQSKTMFGGMENAAAIFYSESSVTGRRKIDKLMAHEIAHQYFGDMVTETDWPHVWLSEGFATYLALLFMEDKYGRDTLVRELKQDRQMVLDFSKQSRAAVVDTGEQVLMELLNVNSYQKGGWVLHMLRQQLGDSTFWKVLRTYYADFAGGNASTDSFRQVVERVSGKDFSRFFRQWLYRAGQPVLKMDYHFDAAAKQLNITITQQQQELYEFPLTVEARIRGGGGGAVRAAGSTQGGASASTHGGAERGGAAGSMEGGAGSTRNAAVTARDGAGSMEGGAGSTRNAAVIARDGAEGRGAPKSKDDLLASNQNNHPNTTTITVRDRKTTFSMPLSAAPSSVILDPDCNLLFEQAK